MRPCTKTKRAGSAVCLDRCVEACHSFQFWQLRATSCQDGRNDLVAPPAPPDFVNILSPDATPWSIRPGLLVDTCRCEKRFPFTHAPFNPSDRGPRPGASRRLPPGDDEQHVQLGRLAEDDGPIGGGRAALPRRARAVRPGLHWALRKPSPALELSFFHPSQKRFVKVGLSTAPITRTPLTPSGTWPGS